MYSYLYADYYRVTIITNAPVSFRPTSSPPANRFAYDSIVLFAPAVTSDRTPPIFRVR